MDFNRNKEIEINYLNEQKQNLLANKSNEEIENSEIKINENIIALNYKEKKKEENEEKKEENKEEEKEEEKIDKNE